MAETQLDRIEAKTDKILTALFEGEGPENPSVMTRLALIEKDASRRDWLLRTAIGAAMASIIAFIWTALTGTK